MKDNEATVIPLTVDMIDEQAKEAPDVDSHAEDYWIGYVTIMAQPSFRDEAVQMISPPVAFFKRELRLVGTDPVEVATWVCEGRAYRHGRLVAQ